MAPARGVWWKLFARSWLHTENFVSFKASHVLVGKLTEKCHSCLPA